MPVENINVFKSSVKGKRPTNEDVELHVLNLKNDGTAIDNAQASIDLFVICDGHGGGAVSAFVAPALQKEFMYKDNIYPLSQTKINNIYDRIQNQLINNESNIAAKCGTTALVVIRYNKESKFGLQVINLGDSRAVASINGLAVPLTKDHKPNWPDEQKRINDVNIATNRVKKIHYNYGDWRIGDLSVSRAFGDLDNVPHVTHIPEIFKYEITKDYEFIIAACDGLWDVLANHLVVNLIKTNINDVMPNDARILTGGALSNGSTDNVSVIVIKFAS
ncbi:MAG: protein serine/threonine phosphatase 2C family protein [Rickettsiales bacterium]|nr:MAG: protein serine/threonine phosphatase 2C family protein [Rickettsiales bacterium]